MQDYALTNLGFSGHLAVVTGAGSGIGRQVARTLARNGARLYLVDIVEDGLEETIALIGSDDREDAAKARDHEDAAKARDGDHTYAVADVSDPAAVSEAADRCRSERGDPSILVTAAGISVGKAAVDTDPEDWDRVFAVNVRGTYLWLRALLPAMIERGTGSAVLIASQLAVNGGRSNAAYIASKGAVVALARTTANDVAAHGVRVNSVLPGATETPLLGRSFGRAPDPEAARSRSLSRHPLGRFATASEVANAVCYLASDAASFTTGTELRVDGGWIAG